MSYSFDDFFMDYIDPEMRKLFRDYSGEDISDKFLDILRRAMDQDNIKNYLLANRLLNIAIDPHQENLSIEKVVQRCVQICNEGDIELRKIEYAEDSSIISVNYKGEIEEEELRNRVTEEIAQKLKK